MILGLFARRSDHRLDPERLIRAVGDDPGAARSEGRWVDGEGCAVLVGRDAGDPPVVPPFRDETSGTVAAMTGRIYGEPGWLERYRQAAAAFPGEVRGRFAVALRDERRGISLLARDPLGEESVFYAVLDAEVVFGNAIRPLLRYLGTTPGLDVEALGRYLLFNYNPGSQTLFAGVRRLPAGHRLSLDASGEPRVDRYWRPSFADELAGDEASIVEALRERLRGAVGRRLEPNARTGIFLSGGMDSSTIAALAREGGVGTLRAFSYRCRQESFDESGYARIMAEACGAEHHEIEYRAADVLKMIDAVREMNEPFSDVGINLATWLLGEAAEGRVDYVLTGDGGDELFAGHPIYEADKIARFVDPVPGFLRWPLLALGRRLPDSDKKKNLTVKIKRFAESLRMPAGLLSNRWRVYYRVEELGGLLGDDLAGRLVGRDPLEELLALSGGSDGRDPLSRALQCDYATVVDFYLRRNDLVRRFGIEVRCPMLDPELVRFCAAIPSGLKIRGWFDTKYVLRRAAEPWLPHEIVHRTDKLGHSIPLKNWMRDDPTVRSFVLDLLSPETVTRRGLFRPEAIEAMVREHRARRVNHSHRLWTLAVLEQWLREFDR